MPSGYYPPRRWPWVVGIVAIAAIAGFLVWFFAVRDTGPETVPGSSDVSGPADVQGPDGAPFTLTLPSGWKALSQEQVLQQPGSPLAVMQQTDGSGVVIINTQAPTKASLDSLTREVAKKLAKTIPDFQLIKSSTISIPAGQAASISYARPKQGTADTLVIVPAGGRIYTLNAVVPGGEEDAARQAAEIINSFNA